MVRACMLSCLGQRYELPAHFDLDKVASKLVLPLTSKVHV